jgi:hypothetical protein
MNAATPMDHTDERYIKPPWFLREVLSQKCMRTDGAPPRIA